LKKNISGNVLNSWILLSLSLFALLSNPAIGTLQGHESWSYNLNLYEVNTRQYTRSGTFQAFKTHLDRLADMGVGILWFMPIHPIGSKNRLGALGSPYSVKDYLNVNPEFGTLDDFKALVDTIHAKGMYVIIDWVANHTSWDNTLTSTNPEWYITDSNGNFVPPSGTNWTDVIQLDYSKQGLRDYMIDAMAYWINEVGVDGFRCDAASFIPTDFWSTAIAELKQIRPGILMLAEDDGTKYQSLGFDMTYAWGMYGFGQGVLKRIAEGTSNVNELDNYIKNELKTYSGDHYRMYFTSNHDENAWYGTDSELFGNAAGVFAALTATVNGMQLIYGGQEAGLNKRLLFFDKDEIPWQKNPYADTYKTLLKLKKENQALWNGSKGGTFQRVNTTNNQIIFSFVREKEDDKIFAVFNLSSGYNGATLTDTLFYGSYIDIFTGDTVTFAQSTSMSLPGWSYLIYKTISTTTGINTVFEPVTDFRLHQNYPNPFNPSTTIRFEIPIHANVTLKIYDLFGREMFTLVNENHNAGSHTAYWNATGFASGVYLYRLQVKNYSETKKLVLLR